MARLNREVVLERENFVRNYFRDNPNATPADAAEAIKAETGMAMRIPRIVEIQKEADGVLEPEIPISQPQADASPPPEPKTPLTASQKAVIVFPTGSVWDDEDLSTPIKVVVDGTVAILRLPKGMTVFAGMEKYKKGEYVLEGQES